MPPASRQSLSTEFLNWLRIVNDRSEVLMEAHLRPFGLSVPQGLLFGLIADRALAGTVPLQKDLEAEMRLVTSSITNLVQGLERKGLIFRTEAADDARAKELHLTDRGWAIRAELGAHVTEWKMDLTASLGDEELAAAVALLRRVAGP